MAIETMEKKAQDIVIVIDIVLRAFSYFKTKADTAQP